MLCEDLKPVGRPPGRWNLEDVIPVPVPIESVDKALIPISTRLANGADSSVADEFGNSWIGDQ